MSTNQASGDVIDAIRPDLESFASLWSALRTNYEGTNITRTVARLLHMYQPEDGILAYERLLRTLYVLLEDFDGDGLRLLVSMVPPPKDVADDILEEVFQRATGFVRMNAPVFHRNSNGIVAATDTIAGSEVADRNKNATPQLVPTYPARQQNIQASHLDKIKCFKTATVRSACKNDTFIRNRKSPQTMPQDSEVFRGFPPNEISNTQSHVQSINHFFKPANYGFAPSQAYVNFNQIASQNSGQMHQPSIVPTPSYRLKWLQAAPYLRKNAYQAVAPYRDFYLKTMDNKYLRLPLTKLNGLHRNDFPCSSQTPSQLSHAQECLRNESANTVNNDLLEKVQQPQDTQESIVKKVSNIENDRDKQCVLADTTTENKPADESIISIESTNLDKRMIEKDQDEEAMSKPNVPVNDRHLSETGSGDLKEVKMSTEAIGRERESLNRDVLKQFEQEVRKRQRAIQEDIYKMDVVRFDEENNCTVNDAKLLEEDSSLAISKKLRKCIQRFLKRMKSDECVDCPAFPQTRTLYEIQKPIFLYATPTITARCNLANARRSVETDVDKADISTLKEEVRRKVVRRKRSDPPVRPRSQRNAPKDSGAYLQTTQIGPQEDTIVQKKKSETECNDKGDIRELPFSCSTTLSDLQSTSLMQQATTMAELAAYKKQYYDALLSIQRAKAAVANSLAISSVGNSTGFDPYYFNYLRQQHQLLQQQQRLLMGSRFPPQRLLPVGLSSVHNTTNPWVRSVNWRYQSFGQFGLLPRSQVVHSPSLYSSGLGIVSQDSTVTRPQHYVQSVHRQPKPSTKRRKLEEIVGKLKETENSSVDN